VEVDDAAALIAPAVPNARPALPNGPPNVSPAAPAAGAAWADLGAGRGTFSRALARLLGPGGRVYAVDRDPAAVAALARLGRGAPGGAAVAALRADFADARALDALGLPPLDGALLANALHFVAAGAQGAVLAGVLGRLKPGGRLVVVEYEERRASRWVPAPVPFARLAALLAGAAPGGAAGPTRVGGGAAGPTRVGSRPSAFGGTMYAACFERPAAGGTP
jgi:SAM-dependent methyltransferase